ncbi:MAG TPA: TonB-dependent receptor, partial [Candidatus Babeliaceae bacterium]|nr:TonB-dependent receptor [Candidatus Babeliaceae bacterium]
VIDSATHERLSYAIVSIFQDKGTSPINGATTDSNGYFVIDNLADGNYTLSINFAGYKTKKIAVVINSSDQKKGLGNIFLASLSHQLKGVEVTADRATIENHLDKLVYDPANDLTTQGGGALDVLKKVPMVSVDVDGNVELLGDNNIQFLINGKPSTIFGSNLADILQAIPASEIKNIEVITSPGAKYDATGTAGIINIILKTNKAQGINGNINLSAGTRLENGSANLSVTRKNLNMNVFFSGSGQINSTTLQTIKRTSANTTNDTLTNLSQQGSNSFSREGYQVGTSINWDITPRQELTLSVQYDQFNNNSNNTAIQQQETTDISDNVLSNIVNDLRSTGSISQDALDYSIGYKNKFRKGQELDILYSASIGNNTNNFSQQDQYITGVYPTSGLISNNPGSDKETNISIDYSQPVSKQFIIETGAKLEIDDFSNTVVTDTLQDNNNYVRNSGQTYSFNYNRDVMACYLSANFSLFKNFIEGKAGVRYEYTEATLSGFANTVPQYGIFSPSFTLSHKLPGNQSVKLSYSYRIERPTYNDLNP